MLVRAGVLRSEETPSQRSLRTDLVYSLLSPATETFSRVLSTLAIGGCALCTGRTLGPSMLEGFGPVIAQPRCVILVEMLVLSDLIYYWMHRLAHSVPLLWRLHAVHHSTQHLRWTSALRAHPAEVYVHIGSVVPLCLLGFPVDGLLELAPVLTLYALFIHSTLDVTLRPLSYVVNTPMFHGWHHARLHANDELGARELAQGGVNFAGLFPLFDELFGTFRLPCERPGSAGIDDPTMPETCFAQLGHPFKSQPGSERSVVLEVAREVRMSA